MRFQEYLLKVNAYCVVLRPLKHLSPQDVARSAASPMNSELHGEAILAEAHSFDGPVVKRGSSTHKIQKYRLAGDCYCVIRRELTGLHS